MTHSRANSSDEVSTSPPPPPLTDVPWSVVTAGKGKHRTKNHQLLSFKPTFVQPRPTATESNQALSGQAPPAPVELVTPYMKGVEKGSVFIDITHVKNLNLLRDALNAFNKDTDAPGPDQGNNEFLGRCEKNRTYLNHVFMETLWAPNTASYNAIVHEGIMLSDNTFIKGFPSYSADASIVRLSLSGLPFLQLRLLKKSLHDWLTRFGEVLDFGLSKKDGFYVGGGYATIAIPTGKPCAQDPCPVEHQHFVPLQRFVPWEEDDGDVRKITLSWDAMPDFCRCCGASDHCRADCPHRLSWMKCFNCNQKGHEFKHCPRNNTATGAEAPNKTRAVPEPPKQPRRKTLLKVNNSEVTPMIVDPSPPPVNANSGSQTAGVHSGQPPDNEVNMAEPDASSANSKHRSKSPEPEDHQKHPKTHQSTDVTDSRKQQQGQHGTPPANESSHGAQQTEGPPAHHQHQELGTGNPPTPPGTGQPGSPPRL